MLTSTDNSVESLSKATVRRVRVFLASPSDVAKEREFARAVIDKLRNEFRYKDRVKFETVAWEQPGADVAQEATLTPQAAIDKGLSKPSDCDVVVVVFWSRMGTPLPAKYTKPDGSVYLSGTEWEFCDAMEAAKAQGRPTVWLYRREEVPKWTAEDPKLDEKRAQWRQVKIFFESFSDQDGAIRGGINRYNEPTDFRAQFEDHLRGWLDRRLAPLETEQQLPTRSRSESTVAWEGTPYPGLRAFTPDEEPIFFGRQPQIDVLLDMLAMPERGFVAVVGASGSGKSSLVAAGLLPALKGNAIDGSEQWVAIRFKPAEVDDNPFMALAVQLAPRLEKHGWRTGDLAAQFYEMPTLLTERLSAQLREALPGAGDLLVVIDQFEEVFTRCASQYLGQFIDLVASAASAAHVRVVITMRADYYRNCVDWPELSALLNEGAYSLPAPGVIALLEVIQGPARLTGLEFEDGLADRMLQDTGDTPSRLALVAFALEKLYEAGKRRRRLTHGAYEAFGGVRGAIAQKAEETYCKLEAEGLDVVTAFGQVFRELATIDGERNVAIRKRAPLTTFLGDALKLKDALVEARLLVSDKGRVEVAHEVLFQSWPRLKEWIDTVRDDLRLHDRVRSEAQAWLDAGRDPHHLWPHERLVPVYDMFDRLGVNEKALDEPLNSFVQPEAERLLAELHDPETPHNRRAWIGDRLAEIGDPRSGVGLREDGVPEIDWVAIQTREVERVDNTGKVRADRFYLSRYLVTNTQFQAFVDAPDGYRNPRWWENPPKDVNDGPWEPTWPEYNRPRENVSWYEAIAFCLWLSHHQPFEVRLPTEHEWQQAATGGNLSNDFPWGQESDTRLCNTKESTLNRTTAVGIYPSGASVQAVLDLAGNVWEWCSDDSEDPQDQGRQPVYWHEGRRVIRGGAYDEELSETKSFRSDAPDKGRYSVVGFRLCRV